MCRHTHVVQTVQFGPTVLKSNPKHEQIMHSGTAQTGVRSHQASLTTTSNPNGCPPCEVQQLKQISLHRTQVQTGRLSWVASIAPHQRFRRQSSSQTQMLIHLLCDLLQVDDLWPLRQLWVCRCQLADCLGEARPGEGDRLHSKTLAGWICLRCEAAMCIGPQGATPLL